MATLAALAETLATQGYGTTGTDRQEIPSTAKPFCLTTSSDRTDRLICTVTFRPNSRSNTNEGRRD